MNTMNAIVKIAARATCGMTNCHDCYKLFGIDDECPYNLDVPDSDCIKLVDYVIQRLRAKAEVSPVTEDDLIDILSEEL